MPNFEIDPEERARLLARSAAALADYEEAEQKPYPDYGYEELRKQPRPEWIISGLLPGKRMASIYGPSSSFKTFITLDMMLHIATGITYAGLDTKRKRVVYLLGEGEADLIDRIDAWLAHYRVDPREIEDWFRVIPRRVPLDDDGSFRQLVSTLSAVEKRFGEIGATVVDTVNRSMIGDENSARDMSKFVGAGDHIREKFGSAVVLVHHTGHKGDKQRGSSALPAALDAEIRVMRDAKLMLTAALELTKMRSGRDNLKLYFALKSQAFNDFEGGLQSSLVAVHDPGLTGTEESSEAAWKPKKHEELLLRIHRELPGNQKGLLSPEWPKATVSRNVAKLAKLEYVEGESLAILPAGRARLRELAALLECTEIEV
jgi:putative DNA primase/helicase